MAIQHIPANLTVGERAAERLRVLAQDAEEGEIPPSEEAERTCREYLAAVASGMPPGRAFPFPQISTGGEGDLSCEWRGDDRTVLALISPSGVMAVHRVTMGDGRVTSRQSVSDAAIDDLGSAVEWLIAGRASR